MKPVLSHINRAAISTRIGALLLVLLVLWLPVVGLAYAFIDDANTISIVVMSVLFVECIVLLRWWGRRVYGRSHPLRHYGLSFTRANGLDLLQGLGIGLASLGSLFLMQGGLGWLHWQSPSLETLRFIAEGLLIGVSVGFGEELIFRGWLLDELQRDFRPAIALWVNATVFAVVHFIRPWDDILRTSPQFLGLVLLGLTLVWAKRKRDRLGLPIGVHGGLVWGYYIVNVGNLVTYSRVVPEWVTGIGNNPVAGLVGLVFLSGLALALRYQALRSQK